MTSAIKKSNVAVVHSNVFDGRPDTSDKFKVKPDDADIFEPKIENALRPPSSNSGHFQHFTKASRHRTSYESNAVTSVKGKLGKKRKMLKKEAFKQAITIKLSGLRMIVESAFDKRHAWLSEVLENWLLDNVNTTRKTKAARHREMLRFCVKYSSQCEDIQNFFTIVDLTPTNCSHPILLLAIKEGNLEAVKKLLSEKLVDPNIVDENGHSALLYSACGEGSDILLELINNGADKHFLDRHGRNVIWYAEKNNNYSAVEELVVHHGVALTDQVDDEDTNKNLMDYLVQQQTPDAVAYKEYVRSHIPCLKDNDSMTVGSIVPTSSTSDPGLSGQQADADMENNDIANNFRASQSYTGRKNAGLSRYNNNDFSSETTYDDGDDYSSEESSEYYDSSSEAASTGCLTGGVKNERAHKHGAIERWGKGVIEPDVSEVPGIIGYTDGMTSCTNSSENNGGTSNNGRASSSLSSSSQVHERDRHKPVADRRPLSLGNDGNEDDEEDGNYKRRRLTSDPGALGVRRSKKGRHFACPYYQRDLMIDSNIRPLSCNKDLGFPTTHRLK
jgi:Ankyrin repeats (3 copies)